METTKPFEMAQVDVIFEQTGPLLVVAFAHPYVDNQGRSARYGAIESVEIEQGKVEVLKVSAAIRQGKQAYCSAVDNLAAIYRFLDSLDRHL